MNKCISLLHLFCRLNCSNIHRSVCHFYWSIRQSTSTREADHISHACYHRNKGTRTVTRRICKTASCNSWHMSRLSPLDYVPVVADPWGRNLYSILHILRNNRIMTLPVRRFSFFESSCLLITQFTHEVYRSIPISLDGTLVRHRLPHKTTCCQVSTICCYPFIHLGGERHSQRVSCLRTHEDTRQGSNHDLDPESEFRDCVLLIKGTRACNVNICQQISPFP